MSAVYIHIPYCKSKCYYCSFYSETDYSSFGNYKKALLKEIKYRAKQNPNTKIDTIYFGGGTPSLLSQKDFCEILDCVKKSFTVVGSAEITLEVNPDTVEGGIINDLLTQELINRISLGVQTHDDKLLHDLGRLHNFSKVKNSLDIIKCANISIDVMFGLPNQDEKSVLETLEEITKSHKVKHISLYALSIEKDTVFEKRGSTTDPDLQADLYDVCVAYLEKKGFNRYEVSNFAKKGFESRHNQKYWNRENYFGFGASAHSFINGVRYENSPTIAEYIKDPSKNKEIILTKDDIIKEIIMLSLRTSKGLDLHKLKKQTGYDLLTLKQKEVDELIKHNLTALKNNTIKLTHRAYFIQNAIAVKLL